MIDRVYHPFSTWEEVGFNMWGVSSDRASDTLKAIEFTGDHNLYGSYMMRVVMEWPISCENALTDSFLNKKAWVGHAAVALALGIPEDITRLAWGVLSSEQQLLANREAERAVRYWEDCYSKSGGVSGAMAQSVLFG